MAQVTNLVINPSNLSANILFMEVPNAPGKVEEYDSPARFIIPYNGFIAGENTGTLIAKGKKTIDVVFTGEGLNPVVSLSCLNCDQSVTIINKGLVTDTVVEYLIFNGQSTTQASIYGGTRSMSEVGVIDGKGAMLSAELNPKSGVVMLYKNTNGIRTASEGYGSVKITHNYQATRFVMEYDAKDFRYFIDYDSFKNAFVSNNGDNLAPDFMKAIVSVSDKNYVAIYSFKRKVQNVDIIVGDSVAFNEGEESHLNNPDNPDNPDNPNKEKPKLPVIPVKKNPYSEQPRNNRCMSEPQKSKSCFDGDENTEEGSRSNLGRPFIFRGMDGGEYVKDKCDRLVPYNAASGKPCNLTFKEESRNEITKKIKDAQSGCELEIKLITGVTFMDKKGSTLKLDFKEQ